MTNNNFGGNTHNQVFASLVLIATVVSSLASLILLALIRAIHREKHTWNGHALLVATMTVFQLLYDLSFFTGVVDVGTGWVSIASNIAQLFSGVLSALMSNWVAWVSFYVIFFKKRFEIFKHYRAMMLVACAPATLDVLLYSLAIGNRSATYSSVALLVVYNLIKVVSILLNFVLIAWTAVLIRRMRSRKSIRSFSEISLNNLSHRLFFYPIVQMLSRIGCAWYEMQFGYRFSPSEGMNFNPPHTSNEEFAAQCVMALSMPIASVGYLLIFLVMQPRALERLSNSFGYPVLYEVLRDMKPSLLQEGSVSSYGDEEDEDMESQHSLDHDHDHEHDGIIIDDFQSESSCAMSFLDDAPYDPAPDLTKTLLQ